MTADGRPLEPGDVVEFRFTNSPTSYHGIVLDLVPPGDMRLVLLQPLGANLMAGTMIRLPIAIGDSDYFLRRLW